MPPQAYFQQASSSPPRHHTLLHHRSPSHPPLAPMPPTRDQGYIYTTSPPLQHRRTRSPERYQANNHHHHREDERSHPHDRRLSHQQGHRSPPPILELETLRYRQHSPPHHTPSHSSHNHHHDHSRNSHHSSSGSSSSKVPQAPLMSSQQALQKLHISLQDTTSVLSTLTLEFELDVARVKGFVDPGVLNYIWQDKLRFDTTTSLLLIPHTSVQPQCTYPSSNELPHSHHHNHDSEIHSSGKAPPPPLKLPNTSIQNLLNALDIAIDTAARELHSSQADNRSLAEKLSRVRKDIEAGREGVGRKWGEVGGVMADMECLGVLVRRFGGIENNTGAVELGAERGSSISGWGEGMGCREEDGEGKGKKKKKRVVMLRRDSSYEAPRCVDEAEEDGEVAKGMREEGDEEIQADEGDEEGDGGGDRDSGFHDGEETTAREDLRDDAKIPNQEQQMPSLQLASD